MICFSSKKNAEWNDRDGNKIPRLSGGWRTTSVGLFAPYNLAFTKRKNGSNFESTHPTNYVNYFDVFYAD